MHDPVRSTECANPTGDGLRASRPIASEAAFEHLAHSPVAGLGAELREWIPEAWADTRDCPTRALRTG